MVQSNRLTSQQYLRYRLLRGLLHSIAHLPHKSVDGILVPIFSWVLYSLVRYRRKVVEDNIRFTLSNLSTSERHRVERLFYHHLSELMLHEPHYAYGSHEQVASLFRLEQTEILEKLYDERHRQVFILLGHIGAWELMGSSALHLDPKRYQLNVIYKQLHDPVADRLTHEMRERHHAHCIEMTHLARTLLHHQSQRSSGHMQIYCLLADQSPAYESVRYATSFFGRTTPFIIGWSQLAAKLQIPCLFYGISYDNAAKQWVGRIEMLCEKPSEELCYQLVDDYVMQLERNIALAPHRWLWSHKRWRYDPHRFAHVAYSPRCNDGAL